MVERAVILAGGKGSRLGPYTTVLPKPLLPGRRPRDPRRGRPPAARLRLRPTSRSPSATSPTSSGPSWATAPRTASRSTTTRRTEPLGTVGAAGRRSSDLDDTFLVMNGDVLTALDYAQLVDVHRDSRQRPDDRVAPPRGPDRVRRAAPRRPRRRDRRVSGFEEKPEIPYMVSMGVYVLEPARARATSSPASASTCPTSCCACSGRAAGGLLPVRRATGSTSDATRTTRRRSSSSSRCATDAAAASTPHHEPRTPRQQ